MDSAPQDARLSNYRLERLLGAGGMGSVYLAHDLVLDRAVAIKFIASERAADDAARRRLIHEARAAAALEHPNICSVHDVIVDADGRACIVMQYVEGETLAQVLRRGPLDVRLALALTTDLASALAAAHARGIIHRDLKPQNIMVTPERRAKLLDFGIARQVELAGTGDEATATSLTGPGAIVGTPAYMSPEQAQQLPLDGRTDLFTLGAVLFECLTGRRAFEGDTPLRVASQVLEHDPPPVSSLRQELSAQHDELCRRLLAKHPDDRFKSAEELLGALRVLTPETGRHPHAGDVRPAPGRSALALAGVRPFRPGRVVAAVAVVMVVAAAAIARDAGLWVWRPAAISSTPVLIGVLPFINDSADARHDATVAGLTRALATRLRSVAPLRVLSADEIREAIRELRTTGDARPDAAVVARSLNAGFVIDGALVRSGSTFEVTADLVRPDGVRLSVGRYAAEGGPLDLQRRLAEGLILALREAAVVTEADEPSPPTENADAFAEYSQGRVFLERPDVPGNLDHAIRLFQGAIAKDREFALAHAGLAEAYWAQFGETKNPEWTARAMAANLEALKIDPTLAEVRMSLAVMYHAQGRRDEAVEELKAVMALQPQNDHVHRLLADIHSDLGEWDAAIAEAKQAATLRGSYWRNHSQLGVTYLRAGRFDDAAEAFRRVTRLQPDSVRGYQALGTALHMGGRLEAALVEYEKAIQLGASGGTYANVGTLYFWRGNAQKAADAYEKAVALQPNNPTLHANLGDAYARLGQSARATQSYERALDRVQKLLTVNPNDAGHLAALALYQAKLGQRDAAAEHIQKAVAISPKDWQVLYHAAIVGALAGDRASACGVLARALEHGASEEEVRNAIELRALKGCPAYDAVVQNVR
jgi:serine/threonine-protein kinase